jgi:hypothetical protein
MVLSVTWQALNRNSMPWLGLLLVPILLKSTLFILNFLAISPEHIFMNAININSLWLLIFGVEAYVKPFKGMAQNIFTLKFYWRMRWLAMLNKPINALMRVFITSLLLSLIAYGQYKIGIKVNVGLQIAATGLIALIIGSYQFNNEKFYQAHQYYLNTLLTQKSYRYYLDTIPMMLLALMASIVMWQWLGFSTAMLLLLPISTLITIKSVSQFERNFFILPFIFHGLAAFVYFMI